MLHIPSTSSLLLAAKHESYNKACHSTKNIQEFSRKKSDREWTSILKKKKKRKEDRKSNKTRQKNKRGDSKVESNDSPEIPDRGETSDIPGLPSGAGAAREFSSPELTLCADSYSVYVPPPCYRSGTLKTPIILPKVQVAG